MDKSYYLKIHYDNHHCGSCWEPSDEWDNHFVFATYDELIAGVAREDIWRGSHRRRTHEARLCPSVIVGERVCLLYDPTDADYDAPVGEPVSLDLEAIRASAVYADLLTKKAAADVESKKLEDKLRANAAAKAERERVEKEREQLKSLRERYPDV